MPERELYRALALVFVDLYVKCGMNRFRQWTGLEKEHGVEPAAIDVEPQLAVTLSDDPLFADPGIGLEQRFGKSLSPDILAEGFGQRAFDLLAVDRSVGFDDGFKLGRCEQLLRGGFECCGKGGKMFRFQRDAGGHGMAAEFFDQSGVAGCDPFEGVTQL